MDRTDSIYCIDKHTNRIILILAIIIASFITGVIAWHMNLTAQAKLQEHLAQEVLRFHILANSDSEEDQALKMDVKEQVLAFLKNSMPDGMDVEETEEWMRRNTDKL